MIRTNRRGTYSVGVDDLIDPSRSAIVGVSGYWLCQRFCRLSKMRACIAGGHVLAHVRRAASPLGVMRHYGTHPPVGVDDHIDPSRSAIVGTFFFGDWSVVASAFRHPMVML